MIESCPIWKSQITSEWVMSHMNASWHIWMSHVTYEWDMSRMNEMNESWHIWMSHVTYEWVISHMTPDPLMNGWMSHSASTQYRWVITEYESWVSRALCGCIARECYTAHKLIVYQQIHFMCHNSMCHNSCMDQSLHRHKTKIEEGMPPADLQRESGVYRVAKIHRMPYLYRSFSAKEPYN